MDTLTSDAIVKVKKTSNENFTFSILIPSWNNLDYLKSCIHSIRKNSFYQHQIIVHINEGKDGTLEWIDQQNDIDYTFNKQNVGICFALNAARTLVSTSYILFMNDDMYACPLWDKYLMDEIQQIGHNNFFLSATAIEPFPGNICTVNNDFGRDLSTFEESKLLAEFNKTKMHDWLGATWPPNIVHVSVWDLVGGYSIEFSPGFYADPDFSMKLWQAGIRLFKGIGKSRVYHFGSKTVKRIKNDKNYYTFIAKWGMTSGTFTKYYLHRGKSYTGILKDVKLSAGIKVKSYLKQLFYHLFHR